VEIKEDRALYWLSQGAQPTGAVAGLLKRLGTVDRLARFKSGEALDILLNEAAASRQQMAEEASFLAAQAEAKQIEKLAEAEVADEEANAEAIEDVTGA
jgi:small subunit ribosomal protein S16